MTNILDTVEPDEFADWLAANERRMHCGQFTDEERMRAAYDAGRASNRKQVAEEFAIAAWTVGMNEHNKALGMPCDAREVGSAVARELRHMAEGEKHE